MRRLVAIFLLMMLPLQAIWAASAPYCQHESDASGQHVGHHQPDHPTGDQSDDAAGTHSDCHVCHGGTVLTHEVPVMQVLQTASEPVLAAVHGLPAPPNDRPERPQWPALA
jgi:hypothetical protein